MHKSRVLAALLCACTAGFSRPPAAPSLNVRLTTALTSYRSAAGSQFQAVVIAPYEMDGAVVLPAGAIVHGTVHRARGVGLGVIRERATLELDFREYELPGGARFPFRASLRSIDNARETVAEGGQINGILAANGPQHFVGGLWHRPRLDLMTRSFVGLTGAGGRIFTAFELGPIGGAVLFAVRCAMFRLPEPEIRLPAGTDMKLTVTELPAGAPTFAALEAAEISDDFSEWLARQNFEVGRPGGLAAPDLINVAMVGSRDDLVSAFRAAGWGEAEMLTARSVSRAFTAYTTQSGYPEAPMSKLLYRGAEADAVFQKSFNTMRKRDHIRIWRAEFAGREVWLGAATHDVGVRLNSAVTFTHRIHPRIDAERAKVVNDLAFAGCVDPAAFVTRPDAARTGAGGGGVLSDGRLAVLFLRKDCTAAPGTFEPGLPDPPNSRPVRIVRRMMLEGRQYALRGNAYYWLYRAIALNYSRHQPRSAAFEE